MSITPRRFAADGPEEGADGEEDRLEDEIEKTTKPPKDISDFLFKEFGDPDEFLPPMAFDSPRAFAILPMPHDGAKAAGDLFSGTVFFPILQQRIDLGHVAIRCAARVAMEAEAGQRRIESIHWGMLEKFAPQVEIGGEFAAVWDF
jgi:hypothetical protein